MFLTQNEEESAVANLGECTSLKQALSPAEEKILLMESGGEDLRRLRQMKPLVQVEPTVSHKRRRHKAYRQSSSLSLYDELANSIEEDSPLPQLCLVGVQHRSKQKLFQSDDTACLLIKALNFLFQNLFQALMKKTMKCLMRQPHLKTLSEEPSFYLIGNANLNMRRRRKTQVRISLLFTVKSH